MPRMSFLGDDKKGLIITGNTIKESKRVIAAYTHKAQVPQSGIRGVRVRATDQWVREITFFGKDQMKVAHIPTGCNEGSYIETELTENEEIVGMFGVMDSNMHLKSFGIMVYSMEEEEDSY